MQDNNTGTTLIIGGGLGGLFTGAILAHEGHQVTIVEKNATIGGGLQSFSRFGTKFDTGMHVIAGMQPGGNIRRICQYLGIADKVKLRDVDDDCTDELYFAEDQQTYRMAKGREGFVNSLAAYFPDEREGLEKYVDDIYAITEELDLFYLRPQASYIKVHSQVFTEYADDFIARHFKSEKLRSIVAYMNPFYGGRGHQTPAFIHAIIHVLYINGASRFVDESASFAELLADVIRCNGGHIIKGDAVAHINVENRHITGLSTKHGLHLAADRYISAIHPCALIPLLDGGAFPHAYTSRLESIPNSYSAFSVFIKLKPNTFPYINHSQYYMSRYDEIWQFGRTDKPWPLGFLFMTAPTSNSNRYAEKVLVTAPMDFERVRRWEQTSVGHRGDDYEAWKDCCTRQILEKVEEIHPGFAHCIDAVCNASPLTIRDFFGSKEGCLSGYSKDAANLALSQLPVVTKIDNLLLTGQNNNLHGFSGVPLTAITTCEAILGQNYIINKINASEKSQ